jgi:Na+-transporting methylmalonyl-CoA/oxaloacetate decarboxylase gamma subunit
MFMSFLDSLLISFFGLGLVFFVLIGLSAVITLESKVFEYFKANKKETDVKHSDSPAICTNNMVPLASAGDLKLVGVDERTAAMIMAIVSDESGIPLSELQFKSIKALD